MKRELIIIGMIIFIITIIYLEVNFLIFMFTQNNELLMASNSDYVEMSKTTKYGMIIGSILGTKYFLIGSGIIIKDEITNGGDENEM
jgi:hypothetical protein